MKKTVLLFTILISINAIIYSQPCLPDGITFSTQTQIDSFQINYPGCTEIEGYVSISGNDITNLNGLNNLVSIAGYLDISYNDNLNNLEGLNNLTSVGMHISIWCNNSLTSISALSNTVLGNAGWMFVEINDNDALINLEGLNSIDTIGDRLIIENNESLTSLSGLQNLKYVSGFFSITHNDALTSIEALYNLNRVGYVFAIGSNSLTSLEGLNNLNHVDYMFTIGGSTALTNLEGLNNLTTVMGEGFFISQNDSLLSLSGLNSLTSTSEIRIEGNPMLNDINALTTVDAALLEKLTIKNNTSLMKCDIESICNYLMLPSSDVEISNNATGCNSEEEVIATCTESVSETKPKSVFTIYPNPATKYLFISSNNELVNTATIYNHLGQKVMVKTKPTDKIDVSMLKQGVYVIELVSHKYKIRHKLIIQK